MCEERIYSNCSDVYITRKIHDFKTEEPENRIEIPEKH